MMMKRMMGIFPMLVVALATMTSSLVVQAQQPEPMSMVQDTTGRFLKSLAEQRDSLQNNPAALQALVEEILLPQVDMRKISASVLGKHWRNTSDAQKVAFIREFKGLLVRTYGTAMLQFNDIHVDYLDVVASKSQPTALVRTKISSGKLVVPVHYSLYLKNSEWKFYDVKIDGVSLVTTYRSSFSEQVRNHGIDNLIRELGEKNRKSQSASAKIGEEKVNFAQTD